MIQVDPLVSVLMTAYNREKYIAEAIESVLSSSYRNFELIIVDDCSIDNTVKIAQNFKAKDKRIKVYVNERNLGDYPNRNKAAGYAKGKYLKYVDADDILYKYSLNYMVEAMEKYPDAGLGLGFLIVDDCKPYPIFYTPEETCRTIFLETGFLGYGPSAAIIKRDSFEELGGFPEKQFVGDQELWFNLALQFPVLKLQPALVWYRVHNGQQIKKERIDLQINNLRFCITVNALKKSKSFFNEKEFNHALKKLKRNHARSILRILIVNKKIKEGLMLWKNSGLTFPELIDGFRPYII
jgi:glycosyltransferase involved in cell wall biosynthesis